MLIKEVLKSKYERLRGVLDERSLRLCLASDAEAMGRGGVSWTAEATGVSRTRIYGGIRELREAVKGGERGEVRVRRRGGGRKAMKVKDEGLLKDLDRLLDPVTRGDPMSPLRWTCKSTTRLARELKRMGHRVSQATVWRLLDELGYSMQSNRKSRDGEDHPDRNAQFEMISATASEFMERGLPVISVDTKKKELIGNFKNGGREWSPKGEPVQVRMHDFADPQQGKAIPYGVYDMGRNEGWVSVGIDHDTAEFAVETIRQWWLRMGQKVYSHAKEILITADGGGSNASRSRLWKWELQQLSNQTGLKIHIRHFPPGTSKWNKIEHRMFCHITENWRARPLTSLMTVVNLISNTRTQQGLYIQSDLDKKIYPTGKKITNQAMKSINLTPCNFHGEWNYSLSPSVFSP